MQQNNTPVLERGELFLTLAMPEMMMVLFFTGDLSFCLADWWSCLMAASATGSVPLSMSSSVSEEDKALLTVVPSIDPCSETRRSDSLALLDTTFWAGSKKPQIQLSNRFKMELVKKKWKYVTGLFSLNPSYWETALLITLSMVVFYSSVAVSHDCESAQCQHSADRPNSALITVIAYYFITHHKKIYL